MKLVSVLLIAALISGCATSAHDRRMADSEGESDTERNVKIGLAVLAVGALAYYAAKSSGGGGGYVAQYDHEWDWDRFWLDGRLSWTCRGVQTGQFAEHARCINKAQTDWRWPNN